MVNITPNKIHSPLYKSTPATSTSSKYQSHNSFLDWDSDGSNDLFHSDSELSISPTIENSAHSFQLLNETLDRNFNESLTQYFRAHNGYLSDDKLDKDDTWTTPLKSQDVYSLRPRKRSLIHRKSPIVKIKRCDISGVANVSNSDNGNSLTESLIEKMMHNTESYKNNSSVKHDSFGGDTQLLMFEEQVALIEELQKNDDSSSLTGPFFGLPLKVKLLFESQRGITNLFDWQKECLSLEAVTNRKNLIYSLPTSGGKTLVAEILMLREIICRKKDALFIVPYVAIVQEKFRGLIEFANTFSFHLEEYAGSKGVFPPKKRIKKNSLFVATMEKAHSLINSLFEDNRLESLGIVVVDELHMIGDGVRGANLEVLLSKLLHLAQDYIHIVAMSATLANIEELAKFLKAEVYTSTFRPVELSEQIKLANDIYTLPKNGELPQLLRTTNYGYTSSMKSKDPDQIVGLVSEVIPQHSCLIFCATKKNCENVSLLICRFMPQALCEVHYDERKHLLEDLSASENEVCSVLSQTIPYGVAYHHSGLTSEERRLIEDAYTDGILCLLTCTSTLAAGVNLPARRVIIRSPYVGRQFISPAQYKQMAGRAGRKGHAETGESIIISDKVIDRERLLNMLSAPIERCESALCCKDGHGIKHLMLSLIGLKICRNLAELRNFTNCTLQALQTQSQESLNLMVNEALQSLINMRLVRLSKNDEEIKSEEVTDFSKYSLSVTTIGRATFMGGIAVEDAFTLYKDINTASDCLVVSSYLHLLFLCVPYESARDVSPDWQHFYTMYCRMSPSDRHCANVVSVTEQSLILRKIGRNVKFDFNHNRFYLSLILSNIMEGSKTIWDISREFNLSRGFVQNLIIASGAFCMNVIHFCKEIELFWPYVSLLQEVQKKITLSSNVELNVLLEIPGVKIGRARQLHSKGYKTLAQIAFAKPVDLLSDIKFISKKVARSIISAAKLILEEKAETLRQEAEELLTIPK